MGAVPVMAVMGAAPEDAADTRPNASTVSEVFVYAPGVTPEVCKEMPGVVPPVLESGAAAVTAVTGAVPVVALVTLPLASTVIVALS
jgi:hypothetical protein